MAAGVNVFVGDLVPEPSADPMVCDPNIKLSHSEMAFLRRGPRFMVRQELSLNDFKTELEKMVAKDKYDKSSVLSSESSVCSDNLLSNSTTLEDKGDPAVYNEKVEQCEHLLSTELGAVSSIMGTVLSKRFLERAVKHE